jgi:signal transduction histidine kinase
MIVDRAPSIAGVRPWPGVDGLGALLSACSLANRPEESLGLICQHGRRLLAAEYAVIEVTTGDSSQLWRASSGHEPAWPAVDGDQAQNVELAADWCGPGIHGAIRLGWPPSVGTVQMYRESIETLARLASIVAENFRARKILSEQAASDRSFSEEVVRLNEIKLNLISNVSHELRTPLTSIRALSELLLDPNIDVTTRHEFAGIINEESERLTRLVSSMLDLSRIQAKGVPWKFEALDLQRELERAVASLKPMAEPKSIDLRLEIQPGLPRVRADADGLQQALINLISNALKFTNVGEVVVTASSAGDGVSIAVSDSGPGMTAEEQRRVFDRFYRGEDVFAARAAGSGLGLAITREILLQHGTSIELESAPGSGSRFSFVLAPSDDVAIS